MPKVSDRIAVFRTSPADDPTIMAIVSRPFFYLILTVTITIIHVRSQQPHVHPPWYNQTMHLRTGPYVNDWIPMNFTKALDYFTMYEVCKIAGHTACLSPPFKKNVPLPGGDQSSCGVHHLPNIHAGALCGNLAGNLLHHVDHQPWPLTRGFLDLMASMIDRGDDTLIFIGDSITRYHFYDATCTAERGGLFVGKMVMTKYPINKTHSYQPHGSFMDGAYIYPTNQSRILHRPMFRLLHFLLDSATPERSTLLLQGPLSKLLHDANMRNQTIMMVLNFGLHIRESHTYRDLCQRIFPIFLFHVTKGKHIVLFRETSAQHFHTANGLFPITKSVLKGNYVSSVSRIAEKLHLSGEPLHIPLVLEEINASTSTSINQQLPWHCAPLSSDPTVLDDHNWRNILAIKVLSELDPGHQHISIIPYFRYTAARHDFHVGTFGDCSHYCASPIMWAMVWEQMIQVYLNKSTKQPQPQKRPFFVARKPISLVNAALVNAGSGMLSSPQYLYHVAKTN